MGLLYSTNLGKWRVTNFLDVHNHKFVSPLKRIQLRPNRDMPDATKNLTEVFNRENIRIAKVPSVFGGSIISFDKRNCYNHLRMIRRYELEVGDAQSVLNFFQRKQRENPQFFYSVQVDEDGRVVNFFWVDARSRMAYEHFGDVVTFDTTYMTNKYQMPFAPFTGVNHHYGSTQFGCALL
ncbi:protein FAR1-RELATED SEQUENCE 5-like [Papaver somniferum]|uniref:protein FAR1-RELATED SEQUENCE 5-like n=1 Tax=Papaver somniferum TaxID=3469 RepID=UPI000E705801|nr:protein FAR1-RELATED SEQUENCE 5-like [Papaver somniferum]